MKTDVVLELKPFTCCLFLEVPLNKIIKNIKVASKLYGVNATIIIFVFVLFVLKMR